VDLFKNNVAAGVGLAFAAAVLAPILMPAMGRIGRPVAKSLVRGGMLMYERGREAMAVAGESVEDLMAEVRAETAATATAGAAAAPAAAPEPARPYGGNGAGPAPNGAASGDSHP
jgi:hypothetical protein